MGGNVNEGSLYENSVEVPAKTENRITTLSSYPTS